jgi:hypothetical protein
VAKEPENDNSETNVWQFLNAVIPMDMKPINFYPQKESPEWAWGASPIPVPAGLGNKVAL